MLLLVSHYTYLYDIRATAKWHKEEAWNHCVFYRFIALVKASQVVPSTILHTFSLTLIPQHFDLTLFISS